MSVPSVVVASLLFALAAVWCSTGILGVTGRLRRNRWVGVRADESMRSEQAFALANRVAGPGMIGAAVILMMGGLLTLGIDSGWSPLFGLGGLIAALFVVGVVSGYGVRAAATVAEDSGDGCGCCSGGHEETHEETSAGGPEATATTDHPSAHSDDPAADCGTSSCGACSLRGVCAGETAQA